MEGRAEIEQLLSFYYTETDSNSKVVRCNRTTTEEESIFRGIDITLKEIHYRFFTIVFTNIGIMSLARWVPCHYSMVRPQVADGRNNLQLWRVAANTLNKQPQTANRGWSSIMGDGCGANNLAP
jgi:hypothetical protein